MSGANVDGTGQNRDRALWNGQNPYGNVVKGSFVGPQFASWDVSAIRSFPIDDRLQLQFRAEFFNVLNHTNFGDPQNSETNGAFGRVTATNGDTRYGGGVWAPSVRRHNGLFYIFFPTPQEGIFVVTAPSMHGPWTAPRVVLAGAGLEDPCPLWDDDGNAYLVHSKLGAGPLIPVARCARAHRVS